MKILILLFTAILINTSALEKIEKYNAYYKAATKAYPYYVKGKKYYINQKLLKAITYTETRGNNGLVSSADARGVMQVIPKTATLITQTVEKIKKHPDSKLQCSWENMDNVENNIHCCTFYLASILTATGGDLVKSVSWYNAGKPATESGECYKGESFVNSSHRKLIKQKRLACNPETVNYVDTVLTIYDHLKTASK